MSETNKEHTAIDVFYVYRKGDKYYIHAEYLENRPDGLHKITYHKILLPLFKDGPHTHVQNLQRVFTNWSGKYILGDTYVNFGFGDILVNPEHAVYTDELIKPGIKEMTICDIEKALGYSIKTVKETDND